MIVVVLSSGTAAIFKSCNVFSLGLLLYFLFLGRLFPSSTSCLLIQIDLSVWSRELGAFFGAHCPKLLQ